MEKFEKEMVEENGDVQSVVVESNDGLSVKLKKDNYKIVEEMRPKTKVRSRVFTSSIGPGSNGFAAIVTLAGIVAIAGIVLAFITLRF